MTNGKVYKYSAYYFKGGILHWLYDSYYEFDSDNPLISQPREMFELHGIAPTLLVIEREEDFVAFHWAKGKWRLKVNLDM